MTAALTAQWAVRALLVDADVDAANLHLVLRPELEESHTFFGSLVPRLDSERCSGSGTCTELCCFHAIEDGRAGARAVGSKPGPDAVGDAGGWQRVKTEGHQKGGTACRG